MLQHLTRDELRQKIEIKKNNDNSDCVIVATLTGEA